MPLRVKIAVFAVLFCVASSVQACPFCSSQAGPTLTGEFGQADLVLVGSFQNPQPGKGFGTGTTDFVVDRVLLDHKWLDDPKHFRNNKAGEKVIVLPKYIRKSESKFVVFCAIFKNMIDPYLGIELTKKSTLVDYLAQAIKLKNKPQPERLKFFFKHLEDPDYEVSMDAFREYAKADYEDYQTMAKKLPPEKIATWLRDPKTTAYRYGLYASLLGHCGDKDDAKLLRSMLDDREKRRGSGVDGMMAAYTMLRPKEGWNYIKSILKDPEQEFLFRYAALRAVRFFRTYRNDLVNKDECVKAVALLLPHGDMADFAIEDLRKWKQWQMTDEILSLFNKKSHDSSVVKRAILRFALQAQKEKPEASQFVAAQQERDKDWVADTWELLKLEKPRSQ